MPATHICTECNRPVSRRDAKLSGNGRTVTAWHRDCYALAGIVSVSRFAVGGRVVV